MRPCGPAPPPARPDSAGPDAGPRRPILDLGTTSTKAVVFAASTAPSGSGEAGYPLAEPEPGAAVQDPEASGRRSATRSGRRRRVRRARGGRAVVQRRHARPAGRRRPRRPRRAAADLGGLPGGRRRGRLAFRRRDALALHQRTGTPVHAMSPLVKLAWLRRERPSLHAAASRWGGVKEFVLGRAGHGTAHAGHRHVVRVGDRAAGPALPDLGRRGPRPRGPRPRTPSTSWSAPRPRSSVR